jgi:hypothetical protein
VPGGDEQTEADFSRIPDLDASLLGARSDSRFSLTIVNGRTVRESFSGRMLTYRLTPRKPGILALDPILLLSGGQTRTLKGPTIQVRDIPPQDFVHLALEPSAESVLPDEAFTLTLRMRVRRLPPPFSDVEPFDPAAPPVLSASFLDGGAIEGLDAPDVRGIIQGMLLRDARAPGIAINEYTIQRDPFDFSSFFDFDGMARPRAARFGLPRRIVESESTSWFEYTLSFDFTARDFGAYTFGPTVFKGNVLTGVSGDHQPVIERVFAAGPAVAIRVSPPPEKDRPPGFWGLMGAEAGADASIDTSACRVGDPIRLTLSLTGSLSFRNARAPRLSDYPPISNLFTVYDQSVETLQGRIRPTLHLHAPAAQGGQHRGSAYRDPLLRFAFANLPRAHDPPASAQGQSSRRTDRRSNRGDERNPCG